MEDLSLTSLRLLLQLLEAKEILDQLTVLRPPMSADLQPARNKAEAGPPTSRMEAEKLMPASSSTEDVRASGLTSEVEPYHEANKSQQEEEYSPCEVSSHLPDLLQDLGWMEANSNSSNNNNSGRCRPPDVVLCTATTARPTASVPEQESPEEQVLAKSDPTCPPSSSSQNSVKTVGENNNFVEEEQQEMTSINPGACDTWRQAGRQLRQISQACCDVIPSTPPSAAIGRPPALRHSLHVSAIGDVSEVDGVLLTPSQPQRTAVDTLVDAVVHIVVNAVVYMCVLKLKKIVL